MQIEAKDIRPGDILLFKRNPKDKVAGFLSWMIQRFYPEWDRWGWHLAFVVHWHNGKGDWIICEATWPKVRLIYLSGMGEFRAYRWFDKEPSLKEQIKPFLRWSLGCRYDVKKYIWTIVCGLLLKLLNLNLGTWENDEYHCWELVEEFAQHMGKPFTKKNVTLLLPEIQWILEGKSGSPKKRNLTRIFKGC